MYWLLSPMTGGPVNRVHWLRARAQRQRWMEEYMLVGYEMQWIVRYYLHQSGAWENCKAAAQHSGKPGAAAYAARKAAMWQTMAATSDKQFKVVNNKYRPLV